MTSQPLLRIDTLDRDVTHVMLTGAVDIAVAGELRRSLVKLVRDGHTRLLIDLSDVNFIDSTGLGVLLHIVKQLRPKRGRLAVACPDPNMRGLFEMIGHNLLFPVDETVDQALAHLAPRRRFTRRRQRERAPDHQRQSSA
jgi:anti-sigma B factor antagonist